MIYTVGYQKLSPADLLTLATGLQAVVVDCRTNATGRVKRGFSRGDLQALLGDRYEFRGADLGGRGAGPTEAGLRRLEKEDRAGRRLLLLCQEEAPGDCHRHRRIAVPLAERGTFALHIYQGETIRALDLEAALQADAVDGGDHDVPSRPLAFLG